jgi:hypothetical protein
MNENDFFACFNSRKREMLLNNGENAANSNYTVSNLTRNNHNKENDVIELKDQQQERFITSSPHHHIIKPIPLFIFFILFFFVFIFFIFQK